MSMVISVVATRLLAPALIVAVAIIVKGYADVGDGFSAGVILALAISLRYIALGRRRAEATMPILTRAPIGAAVGMLLALASGFFPLLTGDPPFTHLPGAGSDVITIGTVELVTALAFDLGIFLLVAGTLVVLLHHLSALLAEEDA